MARNRQGAVGGKGDGGHETKDSMHVKRVEFK